jgi:hypothetical protein
MSAWKDFEKYLNGEWYPGCETPRSKWREDFEEYLSGKTVVAVTQVAPKKTRCRARPFMKKQYNKGYMKQRRAEAIKKGICADCYHEKAEVGRTTCQGCQDKKRVREMKRYHENRKAA